VLALVGAPAWAETGIIYDASTGLGADALKGWLGDTHRQDRIVIRSDESPIRLFFFWDSPGLRPKLSISDGSGARIAEIDLTKGNIVTLSKPGYFVCTISTDKGSGSWFCVVIGSREWDP
jgi:hypothetical protein